MVDISFLTEDEPKEPAEKQASFVSGKQIADEILSEVRADSNQHQVDEPFTGIPMHGPFKREVGGVTYYYPEPDATEESLKKSGMTGTAMILDQLQKFGEMTVDGSIPTIFTKKERFCYPHAHLLQAAVEQSGTDPRLGFQSFLSNKWSKLKPNERVNYIRLGKVFGVFEATEKDPTAGDGTFEEYLRKSGTKFKSDKIATRQLQKPVAGKEPLSFMSAIKRDANETIKSLRMVGEYLANAEARGRLGTIIPHWSINNSKAVEDFNFIQAQHPEWTEEQRAWSLSLLKDPSALTEKLKATAGTWIGPSLRYIVSLPFGLAVSALNAGTASFEEAKQKGVDDIDAAKYAMTAASISAVADSIVISRYFPFLKARTGEIVPELVSRAQKSKFFSNMTSDIIIPATEAYVTVVAANAAQDVARNQVTGEALPETISDAVEKYSAGAFDATLIAGVLGAGRTSFNAFRDNSTFLAIDAQGKRIGERLKAEEQLAAAKKAAVGQVESTIDSLSKRNTNKITDRGKTQQPAFTDNLLSPFAVGDGLVYDYTSGKWISESLVKQKQLEKESDLNNLQNAMELKRLIESEFKAAKAASATETVPSGYFGEKRSHSKFSAWALSAVDGHALLETNKVGIETVNRMNSALAKANQNSAIFDKQLARSIKELSKIDRTPTADRYWLMEENAQGITNFEDLVRYADDAKLASLPEPIQNIVNLQREVNVVFGAKAEELGVSRKVLGGNVELFKGVEEGRILQRFYHEEGVGLLVDSKSAEHKAFVNDLINDPRNKDLGSMNIERELRKAHEGLTQKRLGMLEATRKIPWMPPTWTSPTGKKYQILITDPLAIVKRNIESQANRLAMIEYFGQDIKSPVTNGNIRKLMKTLGLPYRHPIELIKAELKDRGFTGAELDQMSKKDLVKAARESGIELSMTRAGMISALETVKLGNPTKVQIAKLRSIAKNIGSVELNTDNPSELLSNIIDRLHDDSVDMFSKLREDFIASGGIDSKFRADVFDSYVRTAQGLPANLQPSPITANPLFKATSRGIAILNTALSPISDIGQIITNAGVVGTKYTAMAGVRLLTNFSGVVETARKNGVVKNEFIVPDFSKGVGLKSISGMLSEASNKWANIVSQYNVLVAADSADLYFSQMLSRGLSADEISTLKFLDFSDVQISRIKNGIEDSALRGEFVQKVVKATQGQLQHKSEKGWLVNNRVIRELIPYQTFPALYLKNTIKLISQMKESVSAGNHQAVLADAKKLLTTVGTIAGHGVMIGIMKDIVMNNNTKPENDKWDYVADAIAGFVLAPASRFLYNPRSFENAGAEALVMAVSGKVGTIAEVINWSYKQCASMFDPELSGHSETTNKRIVSRVTPVAKAAFNWIREIAYPQSKNYDKAIAITKAWNEKNNPRSGQFFGFAESKYADITNCIALGDIEKAKELYAKQRESIQDAKEYQNFARNAREAAKRKAPFSRIPSDQRRKFRMSLTPEELKIMESAEKTYLENLRAVFGSSESTPSLFS